MPARRFLYVALAALLLPALAGALPAAPLPDVEEPEITREVRKQILGLPYYGVFDLISFEVSEEGKVTLGGYVYHGFLKQSAEKAVKKIEGVLEVENRIEVLPASINDDELRWAVYFAIYRDSPLFRYGSGAEPLGVWRPMLRPWGWRFRRWDAFRQPRWVRRPFWGMEPLGGHAIHIVVRRGEVILVGVVDSEADRDLATLKTRSVFGVRKVTNDLQVEPD
jgi:hypothetical protein